MIKPKHDLEKVKKICEQYLEGVQSIIQFTAPRRSVECVVKILQCSPTDAQKIIVEGIIQLGEKDFSQHKLQWEEVADVYGLSNYKDNDWYVKIMIYNEDNVDKIEEISFHLPESDLVLIDGRVLKSKGEKP